MEILKTIGDIAALISSVSAAIVLLVRPVRLKLFGLKEIQEGQRALLRDAMTRFYYEHLGSKTMTENEYKNFESCFEAYIALNGNSFIKKIHEDVQSWTIV